MGDAVFGIGCLILYIWRRPRVTRAMLYTILTFFLLDIFHSYMIGKIYLFGPGTTEILLWHLMYLDDVPFFILFPLFIALFVESFARRKKTREIGKIGNSPDS